jgi:hypothetical protein
MAVGLCAGTAEAIAYSQSSFLYWASVFRSGRDRWLGTTLIGPSVRV